MTPKESLYTQIPDGYRLGLIAERLQLWHQQRHQQLNQHFLKLHKQLSALTDSQKPLADIKHQQQAILAELTEQKAATEAQLQQHQAQGDYWQQLFEHLSALHQSQQGIQALLAPLPELAAQFPQLANSIDRLQTTLTASLEGMTASLQALSSSASRSSALRSSAVLSANPISSNPISANPTSLKLTPSELTPSNLAPTALPPTGPTSTTDLAPTIADTLTNIALINPAIAADRPDEGLHWEADNRDWIDQLIEFEQLRQGLQFQVSQNADLAALSPKTPLNDLKHEDLKHKELKINDPEQRLERLLSQSDQIADDIDVPRGDARKTLLEWLQYGLSWDNSGQNDFRSLLQQAKGAHITPNSLVHDFAHLQPTLTASGDHAQTQYLDFVSHFSKLSGYETDIDSLHQSIALAQGLIDDQTPKERQRNLVATGEYQALMQLGGQLALKGGQFPSVLHRVIQRFEGQQALWRAGASSLPVNGPVPENGSAPANTSNTPTGIEDKHLENFATFSRYLTQLHQEGNTQQALALLKPLLPKLQQRSLHRMDPDSLFANPPEPSTYQGSLAKFADLKTDLLTLSGTSRLLRQQFDALAIALSDTRSLMVALAGVGVSLLALKKWKSAVSQGKKIADKFKPDHKANNPADGKANKGSHGKGPDSKGPDSDGQGGKGFATKETQSKTSPSDAFHSKASWFRRIPGIDALKNSPIGKNLLPNGLSLPQKLPLPGALTSGLLIGQQIPNVVETLADPDRSLQDLPLAKIAGQTLGTLGGSALGSSIGGALGSLIPIPGVGTAVGALVGGTLGGWLGDWLTDGPSPKDTGQNGIGQKGTVQNSTGQNDTVENVRLGNDFVENVRLGNNPVEPVAPTVPAEPIKPPLPANGGPSIQQNTASHFAPVLNLNVQGDPDSNTVERLKSECQQWLQQMWQQFCENPQAAGASFPASGGSFPTNGASAMEFYDAYN